MGATETAGWHGNMVAHGFTTLRAYRSGGMASKLLQRHLRALAEGHACWRKDREVLEADVQEAYDVMWMTRPGWRQG